ncbi:MAG: HAD hydrolase-like protein, partial [Bacillota bacterium]
VEEFLSELFLAADLKLAACYWCPHHPDGKVEDLAFRCMCRKPEPGLLQMAAHEREIDLGASWLIAETSDDVEAARRAGCSVLRLGGGFDEAADAILAHRIGAPTRRRALHPIRSRPC